jgi:hypothetical protein
MRIEERELLDGEDGNMAVSNAVAQIHARRRKTEAILHASSFRRRRKYATDGGRMRRTRQKLLPAPVSENKVA